ncbi:MAG: alpha/beta hydrolase [Longimicrobiales bacterium]
MKIPVSHGHLESLLRDPDSTLRGGSVFCHPHPVQGGTMHTKAVYRAAQAFLELGLRTLRFNFRGVGCSTGSFDEGIGEEEDVLAALNWLELGGIREMPVVLGGLSFGSMVGMGVGSRDSRVTALVALGTPIHVYDYSFLSETEKPVLVIQGERDQFGTPEEVREALCPLGDHITVAGVPGSGHLFESHFDEMQEIIRDYFERGPGSKALAGLPAGPVEVKR